MQANLSSSSFVSYQLIPACLLYFVGVLSVSWYPPGLSDRIGTQPDSIIPMLLELAHQYQLKVF